MTSEASKLFSETALNRKPKALDLFCGHGGATRGLKAAGFYVVGVDIEPQPKYCGDEFHQGDALLFPLERLRFHLGVAPVPRVFSVGDEAFFS
jgi:SAM-dependent methyltransferase